MKKIFCIIICLISFLSFSCKEEITYKERDVILDKAFIEISGNRDSEIINGLKTIRKYPTYEGLQKTISLWEKDVSDKIEEEIIKTLKAHELFNQDPSLIEDIFTRNYRADASKDEMMKLRRLLASTDVDIKDKLIKRIDEAINGP